MAASYEVTVLNDELLAIDGVSEAELEITDSGAPSVRLEVEPDVDRRRVGESVQQVLAQHGLKSRVAPGRARLEPVSAPQPPPNGAATVLPVPDAEAVLEPARIRRLASLAVEERRDGIAVTVRDDHDGSATASGRSGRRALRDAILKAVSELIGDGENTPTIVAIRRFKEGDREAVSIVLDTGIGDQVVGSAFVTVGWEFAFGRAIWAALTN